MLLISLMQSKSSKLLAQIDAVNIRFDSGDLQYFVMQAKVPGRNEEATLSIFWSVQSHAFLVCKDN